MFSPSLFKLLHVQSKTYIYIYIHTYMKQTKQTIIKTEKHKHTRNITKKNKKISQPEPERYLFAVRSRAGYPVFLCLLCFSLSCFVCVYVYFCCFVCFRLVFLSFCLNTTQYTTLNTNTYEMGLFMTCVKCSK